MYMYKIYMLNIPIVYHIKNKNIILDYFHHLLYNFMVYNLLYNNHCNIKAIHYINKVQHLKSRNKSKYSKKHSTVF